MESKCVRVFVRACSAFHTLHLCNLTILLKIKVINLIWCSTFYLHDRDGSLNSGVFNLSLFKAKSMQHSLQKGYVGKDWKESSSVNVCVCVCNNKMYSDIQPGLKGRNLLKLNKCRSYWYCHIISRTRIIRWSAWAAASPWPRASINTTALSAGLCPGS